MSTARYHHFPGGMKTIPNSPVLAHHSCCPSCPTLQQCPPCRGSGRREVADISVQYWAGSLQASTDVALPHRTYKRDLGEIVSEDGVLNILLDK